MFQGRLLLVITGILCTLCGNAQLGKKIHFKSIQDKEDIALLGHARAFMRRWSAAETEAFEQGKKAVEESEAQLLEKTRSVFNSFAWSAGQSAWCGGRTYDRR